MLIQIKKITINLFKICYLTFYTSTIALADGFGPIPISLKNAPVPEVPGLLDGPDPVIVDKEAAIILGKALFWEMNVGSDGVACATCHFHAGADRRTKNQLSPTGRDSHLPTEFTIGKDGTLRGPNTALSKHDFPFFDTDNPTTDTGTVTYNSNDVVSSAGTYGGNFQRVNWFHGTNDNCDYSTDPVFHVGAIGTRKVEPRNTPTVINAVFNFRNFWDGRANNIFNGSSPWGDRDPDAGVWVMQPGGTVSKERMHLINSSLASQSVSPPVDNVEMACENRTFADLGQKLLFRMPLEHQAVHWNDSVLGGLAFSTEGQLRKGLNTRYLKLVMDAFNPKYWSYPRRGPFGAPSGNGLAYSQAEANFAMFFGLALQMYQSTLISDDSPFDRSAVDEHGAPIDLSESARRGMEIFREAHCALCHIGPNFTSSAVVTNGILQKINPHAFGNESFRISSTDVVTLLAVNGGHMFQDVGFNGTGVTPDENDPGLGGTDPFGNPLSFSDQYMQLIAGNDEAIVDPYVEDVRPCDMDFPIAMDIDAPHQFKFTRADGIQLQKQDTADCFHPHGAFIPTEETAQAELEKPDRKRFLSAAAGSFKVPTLRNIELTGPYMHNGGMATLEQTIEFYTRGGNFEVNAKEFAKVFTQPELRDPQHLKDLLNFLKSLTDERVRYERAPFDHPELYVPHGHTGDNHIIKATSSLNESLAADEILVIPAVGAEGSAEPLQPFEYYLD
ncbi:cytochrome-c peroxidase [Nitrosomonas marina]|uniref:Di-haem cytochrome c peroxidase n=1 Tax=Nitrosomonas marina TaxID=917 RepID=A0A1H8HPV2_9PROT|nr:cytochrome c peroxidase [Nitrosomonas marina]SEN57738.1 Di-haem cytochrome c peroxidase [Nitrosomonas marina]